ENLLTYDRTFADKHNINVVGLYSAEQVMFNSSQVRALHIPADQFQFYNLGHATGEITVDPNNQGYYKTGLMSWMGRVMYDYDRRSMLIVPARADASSSLVPCHQCHPYPPILAVWNLQHQTFIDNVTSSVALKPKVGYQQTPLPSLDPHNS